MLDENYRAMWSQVVLQAKSDLETEQRGSTTYEQAEAFFLGNGQWAEARASIASMVDLHSDDLTRLGRLTIAARRATDGLPPMPLCVSTPAPKPQPAPVPTLVASFALDRKPAARRGEHIYGGRRRHGSDNPFSSPFRFASGRDRP